MQFWNSLHARQERLPGLVWRKENLFYFSVFRKIMRVANCLSWLNLLYCYIRCCFFIQLLAWKFFLLMSITRRWRIVDTEVSPNTRTCTHALTHIQIHINVIKHLNLHMQLTHNHKLDQPKSTQVRASVQQQEILSNKI